MGQGFGEDFKELVRSSTNIVDLVSETIALKPLHGGRDYVGLCPFHDDKNPSFHVYPDRQSYRCWVCDAGGDCFRWVMEIERVPFPEALESLARRARLEIPKHSRTGGQKENAAAKSDSIVVVEWAVNLMHQALRTAPLAENARKYVLNRKLSAETVSHFKLGYHPEDWNWFLEKARGRFTPAQLISAGLIQERDNSHGYFDNLVGRLVFPIFDERGRPVAFGGRVLPGGNIESDAKYWNSVESAIFHKRRMLFAFDRARETIRRSKTAIIVEGYMDCIACHQAGVTNAVATLGTAMTEEHVRFLRRFAEKVVLVYDSDDAGQQAAERSISRFLAQDLDLRILNVPSGKDPADYLEEHSAEEFNKLIDNAAEAWEYKLRSVLRRTETNSIAGRQQILNQMLEFLLESPGLASTVREDMILKNVCWRVQVDERTARQQLNELRNKNTRKKTIRRDPDSHTPVSTPRAENAMERAEREVLEIILTCPETIDVIRHHIGADDFENVRHQRLLVLCVDLWKEDGDLPELGRLIIAAESDSDLLSLINAVVDSAEEKGIFRLMTDQPNRPEENGTSVPNHLERVLGPFLERREKRLHLVSKQLMSQTAKPVSEFDDDAKDALRRLTKFRQSQMGHPSSMK
ncbi:MAG TPA: DNA primase [Planctomycetaceae bacterium]|mgnify:CR=1 FL=1|nr:DNA primase [Planctomycetaceae bacterium]HRA87507.1 DNA primase [Planctomycetaceae bacterium]